MFLLEIQRKKLSCTEEEASTIVMIKKHWDDEIKMFSNDTPWSTIKMFSNDTPWSTKCSLMILHDEIEMFTNQF